MGATLVVDNRGSVGGMLGAELGAKSPPDRYTLLLAANTLLTINPRVYKKLPYDPQRDPEPITQLTEGGNVVVVHPSVPAKSIKEFIALAKAQPGDLNYAMAGYQPTADPPARFQQSFQADLKRWGELVRLAKIVPE